MSRKYFSFVAVALLVVASAGIARADLLMQDIFDGADPTAYNDPPTNAHQGGLNSNLAGRLTGTDSAAMISAGSAWSLGYNFYGAYPADVKVNSASSGQMNLYAGTSTAGQVNTAHSFDSVTDPSIGTAGGFTVVVDWAPKANVTSSSGYWSYIAFGAKSTTGLIWNSGTQDYTYTNTGDDFAFIPQGDGHFRSVAHGWSGTTLTPAPYPTYDSGSAVGKTYRFEFDVTTANMSNGTAATVNGWVAPITGGVVGAATQLDLNGTNAGLSASFTWDGDGTNNIGFFNYDDPVSGVSPYTTIDNFKVYSGNLNGAGIATPEPSTLALLAAGLAGLLAYAWRKRR